MKNEYGVKLEKGYAPSIVPDHGEYACWACGRNGSQDPLNRHEIFGGPFREKSKRLGLWVHLCHNACHQGPGGVHNQRKMDLRLKQEGQRVAQEAYGWDEADFIREFGRNYEPEGGGGQ